MRTRGKRGRFERQDVGDRTLERAVDQHVRNLRRTRFLDAMGSAFGVRRDAWSNSVTGLGTSRDKGTASTFSRRGALSRDTLESMHDEDDLVHRICNLPADEMTREWINLSVSGTTDDAGVARAVLDELEELNAPVIFQRAIAMARLNGGSVVVCGVDDRREGEIALPSFSAPLDSENVRRVLWLDVYGGRTDIDVGEVEWNTARRGYGRPKSYRIAGGSANNGKTVSLPWGTTIEASRALRFRGISTTRRRFASNLGWDQSLLEILYETLRGFGTAFDSAAHLMTDLSQGVFTIKGLAKMLAGDQAGLVLSRLQDLDLYRSTVRAIPIDDGEAFERGGVSGIEGAANLLDRLMLRLSAATNIPVSILMGRSPAGLNATGEAETRTWYDLIRAQQNRMLRPTLNKLVELILRSKDGPTGGVVPKTWAIEFKSLWQTTETERLTQRKTQADIDRAYFDMGVPMEAIASARFVDGEYTTTAPDVEPVNVEQPNAASTAEQPTTTYSIEAYGNEWAVVLASTGEVVAIHPTAEKARANLAALEANVQDARNDDTSAEVDRKVAAIMKAIDTSALGDRIVAAVGAGIVQEGRAAMDAAGSAREFDVNTPAVNEYIRGVRTRATQINATTAEVVKRAARQARETGDVGIVLDAVESRMKAIERMSGNEARLLINFCRAEAARQAGKRKTWNAVMDSRTRPQHRTLHGKTIGAASLFEIGADRADGPGGFSRPENSVNCRCWLTFSTRGDADLLDEAIGLEERATKLAPVFASEIGEETARQVAAVRAIL